MSAPRRILVTGAGGAPATNFVRSLRESPESFHLIGVDCNRFYLQRAETDERHLVPETSAPDYFAVLEDIARASGAELIHCQPDQEVDVVSARRDELHAVGVRTFLPRHETIRVCQDKLASYEAWRRAGLTVPTTHRIENEKDLDDAFRQLGPTIWLRAIVSPGGGKGSIKTSERALARAWLDHHGGWGNFTAAECLEADTITWTALYSQGELVTAQGRKRLYWEMGNRAISGVTGLTGTGVTVSDPLLDKIATRAIHAIDREPHGIFAVDCTYDRAGVPNPTEINIGRFFTTHLFFSRAGLNLPYILVKLAFDEACEIPEPRLNPLPAGLAWIRGMDFLPVLSTVAEIEEQAARLQLRRERLRRSEQQS